MVSLEAFERLQERQDTVDLELSSELEVQKVHVASGCHWASLCLQHHEIASVHVRHFTQVTATGWCKTAACSAAQFLHA